MYEMRAESSAERGHLLWHVIAKDTTLSTLCGSLLNPGHVPPLGDRALRRPLLRRLHARGPRTDRSRRRAVAADPPDGFHGGAVGQKPHAALW